MHQQEKKRFIRQQKKLAARRKKQAAIREQRRKEQLAAQAFAALKQDGAGLQRGKLWSTYGTTTGRFSSDGPSLQSGPRY